MTRNEDDANLALADPHKFVTRASYVFAEAKLQAHQPMLDMLVALTCQLERAQYELGWDLDEVHEAKKLIAKIRAETSEDGDEWAAAAASGNISEGLAKKVTL